MVEYHGPTAGVVNSKFELVIAISMFLDYEIDIRQLTFHHSAVGKYGNPRPN